MMKNDLIYTFYKDKRTVFTFNEIAMLMDISDHSKLKNRINYYVKKNKIKNLRRGIYAKEAYSAEELACKIYKPSYISLDYVLQKEGLIFQYNPGITGISYLSRTIKIEEKNITYRKLKNTILIDTSGINMSDTGINIATPERAFLDTLYFNQNYYFDSLINLNKDVVFKLLPIYKSVTLNKRLENYF